MSNHPPYEETHRATGKETSMGETEGAGQTPAVDDEEKAAAAPPKQAPAEKPAAAPVEKPNVAPGPEYDP